MLNMIFKRSDVVVVQDKEIGRVFMEYKGKLVIIDGDPRQKYIAMAIILIYAIFFKQH